MEKFAEKCYIFRRLGNVAETSQTIQSELPAILVSFIILFAISLSGENGEMEPGLCVCAIDDDKVCPIAPTEISGFYMVCKWCR